LGACVLSPINRHQSPTEQAPKMPISTAQRVLTHILSQFSKATLTDPGFMVSVPIQHLCVKINLADEPTTAATTAAMRIRAFPAIHKNVEGA
jgi:hypothetical protein